MNRKHIWVGMAVLVSLCLLVSSGAASQTTLKEGNVDLAQSYYTDFEIPEDCGNPDDAREAILMRVDYLKKGNEYTKYIIYNASIDNAVAYSSIPDVVTQSITLYTGKYNDPVWVGTGTFKIYKLAYNDSGYVHADIVVELDIDSEWQNDIAHDWDVLFADENKVYTFSSLAAFYDVAVQIWGGGDYRSLGMDVIWDTTGAAHPHAMVDELGLSVFAYNQIVYGDISSVEGLHTIGILSDFYNAYEIYVEETYGGEPIKYVDITRDCEECELKNTRSKVVVLDEDGEVLLDSPFYQDTNTSHPFGSVGINVFLGAANMSEGGTGTEYVFLYSDTEEEPPDICYVKGYTYNAETTAPLSDVSVTLNGHSDTSDGDGVYFVGPIFTGKNYTLTATKSGYHDVVYPLYLAYGQDYLIDLPLIPVHPTHTGHGILGTVRTLPYYEICENHTVNIDNGTWNDTTTANSVGYYLFDNLEVDDYWINVSKAAYRDNNQSVEVSATGDEIETIDACDATTNWSSDNSLTLNTTDKQEGTGSLQSSGSNTLDFNKSAPTVVDASNVTKSNGYMTFWYKVNDTTRITDYLVFTVGSNGDNTTDKISWSVYKTNFVNDTWREIWLKFSDGTETGTLNMSNVNWIEVKAAKSDNIISKIDNIRFYDFSYEIHNVDLDPILGLGVIAKTLSGDTIQTFTAILDGSSLNTTSGEELIFTNLSYGMHELTVTSEGYFPYQQSVYLDSNTNITAYMTTEQEGGAGVYYPPPHLVEFRVVDIWGVPLSDITVNATGYETTVVNLSWWQKLFGFSEEIEVYNTTMEGTTDSIGHISFFMVETIKYKMWFTNASQNISAYQEIYPKDDRYTITIGEIPTQKIAYWITSEQNDTANTGNITLHYSDYNSPVKTNWVNFSIYYLDNNTLAYTYNFTTINETNENASSDLNASYSYKIKCVADHDDFGVFTWYATVVFIMPEKPKLPVVQTLKDSLEDWQLQTFSLFVIILFALIFGAYSSGVGGMVVSFTAIGFHLFGMMPLVPTLAGAVIYPLIAVMAILNLLSEQKGEGA